MVAKKFWEKSILEFTLLLHQEKKKRMVKVCDVSFEVLPNVFSPIYASDTAWFAEKMIPLVKNQKFLEIGSGTGIIACLAALHGAASVVATDISPQAIKNILSNAKRHSLPIDARIGSVFDPISQRELFDVVFWNHPFYCSDEESDLISLSVCDPGYHFLRKFFVEGKRHLNPSGQLILGTSNVARINLIKKFAHEQGYKMQLLDKTEVPVYKGKKTKMDLRVYTIRKK